LHMKDPPTRENVHQRSVNGDATIGGTYSATVPAANPSL
jgi:hypothetical protein